MVQWMKTCHRRKYILRLATRTSWWLNQPIWKICKFVELDHFPRFFKVKITNGSTYHLQKLEHLIMWVLDTSTGKSKLEHRKKLVRNPWITENLNALGVLVNNNFFHHMEENSKIQVCKHIFVHRFIAVGSRPVTLPALENSPEKRDSQITSSWKNVSTLYWKNAWSRIKRKLSVYTYTY